MTKEEAIENNKNLRMYMRLSDKNQPYKFLEENYIALDMAIKALEQEPTDEYMCGYNKGFDEGVEEGIKATVEPCDDVVSRQAAIDIIENWLSCDDYNYAERHIMRATESILYDLPSVRPQEPKTGHCKDCKWWKDSDGAFRRGIGAESQCPINREEVYEGNGYCFLFEPQEMETWNGIHAQITAPKGTFERIFNEADDENDIGATGKGQ